MELIFLKCSSCHMHLQSDLILLGYPSTLELILLQSDQTAQKQWAHAFFIYYNYLGQSSQALDPT